MTLASVSCLGLSYDDCPGTRRLRRTAGVGVGGDLGVGRGGRGAGRGGLGLWVPVRVTTGVCEARSTTCEFE